MQNASGALVVAHPGHELRLFGWLCQAHPRVFVLTDGSGRTGRSRLEYTTHVLGQTGATPGEIYGRFTDRQIYSAILGQDVQFFIQLVDSLARIFVNAGFSCVVGDAMEGYNSVHDACRLMINAAVTLANREVGAAGVSNFEFAVVGSPDSRSAGQNAKVWRLHLDEAAFTRKLGAAREYTRITGDVDRAIAEFGVESFRDEYLWLVSNNSWDSHHGFTEKPYYETYGERQVAAGHYTRVIRYREHILPLARALESHCEMSSSQRPCVS